MKSLLVLILLAALAAGSFVSRPNEEAHKAHADKTLAEERQKQVEANDLSGFIGNVLDNATREDRFDDFFLVTKYTAQSGGRIMLECWGAFSQILCSKPPG